MKKVFPLVEKGTTKAGDGSLLDFDLLWILLNTRVFSPGLNGRSSQFQSLHTQFVLTFSICRADSLTSSQFEVFGMQRDKFVSQGRRGDLEFINLLTGDILPKH